MLAPDGSFDLKVTLTPCRHSNPPAAIKDIIDDLHTGHCIWYEDRWMMVIPHYKEPK